LSNAGPNPIWTRIENLNFEVDRSILAEEKLVITVKDEDTVGGDKILGTAKKSLRALCPRINTEVIIDADLAENGVVKGKVKITAILRPASKEELVETLPESAIKVNEGLMSIKKISVHNLKGGDSGFLGGGKQVKR
jgi:hypothetical protein